MSTETNEPYDDEPHIAGRCLVWTDQDGTQFLPLREIKRWSVDGNKLDVFNDFTVTEDSHEVVCNWWRIESRDARHVACEMADVIDGPASEGAKA